MFVQTGDRMCISSAKYIIMTCCKQGCMETVLDRSGWAVLFNSGLTDAIFFPFFNRWASIFAAHWFQKFPFHNPNLQFLYLTISALFFWFSCWSWLHGCISLAFLINGSRPDGIFFGNFHFCCSRWSTYKCIVFNFGQIYDGIDPNIFSWINLLNDPGKHVFCVAQIACLQSTITFAGA